MKNSFLTSYQQDNLLPVTDWKALDDFWANLSDISGQGWYLYTVSELPPEVSATEDQVQEFIVHIDTLLHKEQSGGPCRCVFTDNIDAPSFIKVLDPLKVDSIASDSNNQIPAGWTLSLSQPVELRGISSTRVKGKPELSLVNSRQGNPAAPTEQSAESKAPETNRQPAQEAPPTLKIPTTTPEQDFATDTIKLPKPGDSIDDKRNMSTESRDEDELELSATFDVDYEPMMEMDADDDTIYDKTEQNQVQLIPALVIEPDEQEALQASIDHPVSEHNQQPEDDNVLSYKQAYQGRLVAINQWTDLDEFWNVLHDIADEDWYIYAVGEQPPTQPAVAEKVHEFILEIDTLLRRDHDEDYCKIVYADDHKAPRFIKIYDPNNLGIVCGSSDNPPLPGWTLSKQLPVDLQAAFPPPGNRRRWWQKIFGA